MRATRYKGRLIVVQNGNFAIYRAGICLQDLCNSYLLRPVCGKGSFLDAIMLIEQA